MSYETFLNAQRFLKNQSNNVSSMTNASTEAITGILDIAHNFEVIVFNPQQTLINNGCTLPAGAVAVPSLRKEGCKLAILSDEDHDITGELNHLGFSFSPERIFTPENFSLIFETFPFTPPQRILLVTADDFMDLSLAHSFGLKTLLVQADTKTSSLRSSLAPDYLAKSL